MLSSKKTLLFSTLAMSSCPLWANTIPNAGQLLKQQQQEIQTFEPQAEINIEIPKQQGGLIDSQQELNIHQIVIQGNEEIATPVLNNIIEPYIGMTITLAELQQVTQKITDYYHEQGYIYSRAYLPAQTLEQGVVKIAILEAKYDQIHIENQSDLSDSLIQSILHPLQSGDIVSAGILQQQLMILNGLNGVKTRNVLSAGRHLGTSDLTVLIENDQKTTSYVGLDNFGNEYTKEWRLNAGIAVRNLLGLGDEFSLNAMSSGELNYGRLGYEATVNGSGTRLGASYSDLDYNLIKEYKDLDANGRARQASTWISQPVLLNNKTEVVLVAQYDFKWLEDDIQVADLYRHRDIHVGQISLNTSHKDNFSGGGLTKFGVSTDFGYVSFKNANAKAIDLATAHTQGAFTTAAFSLSRLQNLGKSSTQLYTEFKAQFSPDNLDSAQQFTVGGVSGIAGYKNSTLSGSSGYYALAELKQNLYSSANHQVMGKVYIDTTKVKRQATTWDGLSGDNQEKIHSTGFGMNWVNSSKWSASLLVGFPIGKKPSSLSERNDVESWFSISKQF